MPNAPVITGGTYELGTTDPEWFDAVLDFAFVHGSFPVGQLEVWLSITGGPYALVTTLASTEIRYRHAQVEQNEDLLEYKLRYVSGTVTGPFSNVCQIQPQL